MFSPSRPWFPRSFSLATITASLLLLLTFPVAHAGTSAHLWSRSFGSTTYDYGRSVAVDASGNVFVAGFFEGTVNFGGVDLTSVGGSDIFLAKYNSFGEHLWSQRFGSTNVDYGYSVAVDGSGNVFMSGSFTGTVTFGGVALMSAGSTDIVLAKYNPAGAHLWSQRFGSTGPDDGNAVAVDGSGNVLMTGSFNGTVAFGGVALISAGSSDIVLAKYNSAGTHQWSQRFGGTNADFGYGVAVDGSGNVSAAGAFQLMANFGGGALTSAGGYDVYLAKYNSAGTHQWSKRFGSTSTDVAAGAAMDGAGNAVVTGYFNLTVDFGGGGLMSAGAADIFLAKYNSAGTHQWSRRFGGSLGDFANAVTVDASANVIATGMFSSTVDFGGGPLVGGGTSIDIFLAKFDANATHLWSSGFGSAIEDIGYAVAVDASGSVFSTGSFSQTVSFGGDDLTSAGTYDIFLARFGANPAAPAITSVVDIANDQGRSVRISFARSGGDDNAALPTFVERYDAFRRIDALPATAESTPTGAPALSDWEFVASIPAFGEDAYHMVAPTLADSTISLGMHETAFFVRAVVNVPHTFFDSPADSGYSLDNLAPGVPGGFAYSTGQLSWDESSAEDFDYFTVYGSNTDSFSSATVVDYSVDPAMDVTASPYVYYYVTATDFSGNEGRPARVNTLSGADDTPKSYVLSVSNFPNPFNPRTTVSYTVPSRGAVSIAIYDAQGARVAMLLNGEERDAGAYRVEWDGRTEANATASSGVYFARIEHAGTTRTKKMVLLK